MSSEIVRLAADRIAEHVEDHNLKEIDVVFHGGEPLLAGADRLNEYATIVRQRVQAQVKFGMQTNGTLIAPPILQVLASHDIRIGISLDGSVASNDRHRVDHRGRSSHDAVMNGLELIRSRPEWSRLFGGVLAVIDLANDPVELFRYFTELEIPSIDLLLPDGNHDRPPSRGQAPRLSDIAYGEWLARFFVTWYTEQSSLEIKYFEEIIALLLGGESGSEAIGLTPVDIVVIESDGDIESVDTLKTADRRATNLGLNVRSHSLNEALSHPAVISRQVGREALCESCQSCPEVRNCGGGYLPHRFRSSNGFLNPSVYCADLKHLFSVIRSHIGIGVSEPSSPGQRI